MPRSTTSRRVRSLLCPVDFSPNSRAALAYAATLASALHGRLTVLYVNDPLLLAAAAAQYKNLMLADTARSELERFTRRALTSAAIKASRVTYRVTVGAPAHEITRWAAENGIDLIVMGTEGIGGAWRLLLGSTAKGVLLQSRVPVLIVPSSARSGRRRRASR